MVLDGVEFLRRFTMHILPSGYRRMRHFGILGNSTKKAALEAARKSLLPTQTEVPKPRPTRKELRQAAAEKLFGGKDPRRCPCCGEGQLVTIGMIPQQRPPPAGTMPKWMPLETE